MPVYEFTCKKCRVNYELLLQHDPSGKYKGVACPECGCKRKDRRMSVCTLIGTDSQNSIFDIKAGKAYERAQAERRQAEAASHMGNSPYNTIDDMPRDLGIHDR